MSLSPTATQANCVWCQRLARNGCLPEVCGHLGGGSAALAAQRSKEKWVAEASAEADRKAGVHVSALDWSRDDQQVRARRCEIRDGAIGHDPGVKCGRPATWSTDDVPGITWMCDDCCKEILRSADIAVEEIDQ